MKIRWVSLDLLRGLAALLVFTFHFYGLAIPFSSPHSAYSFLGPLAGFFGSIGTNALLLLSGFLLGKSEINGSSSYFSSLAKRTLRIYPTYVIVILSALIFGLMFPHYGKVKSPDELFQRFLEQLVLWPGIFPGQPVLTVSWTLSFIFAGYITLPILARIYRRIFGPQRSLALLWFALVIAILFAHHNWGLGYFRLAYIPAGCLIAEAILRKGIVLFNRQSLFMSLVGAGCLLVSRYEIYSDPNPNRFLQTLFIVSGLGAVSAIVLVLFSSETVLEIPFNDFVSKAIRWTGQRGYSIYLFHGPVTKVIVHQFAAMTPDQKWPLSQFLFLYGVCLIATLVVSNFTQNLLEIRLTNWLSHRLRLA